MKPDDTTESDNTTECEECFGKGYNDVSRAVLITEGGMWQQEFREICDRCDGTGKIHHAE